MTRIRPPAVAGSFYPARREDLRKLVDNLLHDAGTGHATPAPPKALIAPHAGYIYSGPVAAHAYARLLPYARQITRVILLGPVHRVPVRGLALPGTDGFATPLGTVRIDTDAAASVSHLPQVTTSADAHMPEHSLEVHLPFLQQVLTDFRLLPLAVGDASAREVADVLDILWGGPETLIVVSSDLSHYLPYEQARRTDSETCKAILSLSQTPVRHDRACGGTPVSGLLLAAQRHHLHPQLLDLRNSGDTAGDRDRVVGYAAFAFNEAAPA
jgi:hypothetical protein